MTLFEWGKKKETDYNIQGRPSFLSLYFNVLWEGREGGRVEERGLNEKRGSN